MVAIAVLVGGCSPIFMYKNRPRPNDESTRCSDTALWPVLDATFAAYLAYVGVWVLTSEKTSDDRNPTNTDDGLEDLGTAVGVLHLLLSVPWGVAAGSGTKWVIQCRRKKAAAKRLAMKVESDPPTDAPPRRGAEGQLCERRVSASSKVNSLHGQATAAAAAGKCRRVTSLVNKIASLDRDYYMSVMRCDEWLWSKCVRPPVL